MRPGSKQRNNLKSLIVLACLQIVQIGCEELPTEIDRPVSAARAGICYVDPECADQNADRARDGDGIRDVGTDRCTDKRACSELWKCPLGAAESSAGSCEQGVIACAHSPDCFSQTRQVVQTCDEGRCVADLAACEVRIRIEPYSFTPNENQCNCATADPTLNAVQMECSVAPPAPSFLRVTPVSQTAIDLQWDDNAVNEEGFRIERKEGCCGPWIQVGDVGVNTTLFRSDGLRCGTSYAYRVWAYNANGESARSNEARTDTVNC